MLVGVCDFPGTYAFPPHGADEHLVGRAVRAGANPRTRVSGSLSSNAVADRRGRERPE
ncbi:hypothetical protein EKD16_21955 [Streptomonospora litoralis]|uniref:Uncharacterized protein n=1 Tax=Streptomonospora litoralis TaxID=2498135 RepID=A0A4P6Q9Y1_9ACTN|nr:hypothetical protein EKD16_21955 [Streptomonospora litoralis]